MGEDNKIPEWLEKTPYWVLVLIVIIGIIGMAILQYYENFHLWS